MSIGIHPEISAWQDKNHELGMLEFAPSDELISNWYYPLPAHMQPLATSEADLLCLDARTGELLVFDHEVPDRILCPAAKDQAAFLAAAAALTAHFKRCGQDDDYADDEASGVAAREKCAALAGGDAYEGFYCGLLGW